MSNRIWDNMETSKRFNVTLGEMISYICDVYQISEDDVEKFIKGKIRYPNHVDDFGLYDLDGSFSFEALQKAYSSVMKYSPNNSMHQAADPNDAGWDLVKGWFDQGDDDDTVETPLPENYCKKCRAKMRELNTGFRKKMYACPNCDK